MNFKNIHVGEMIRYRMAEYEIDMSHLCNLFKCTENEIYQMYETISLDSETLLKWCKLLEYDFFRLYSQHLILYTSYSVVEPHITEKKNSSLLLFRKNIYTQEIINYILEQIGNGEMTRQQVIISYRIPKTTLYKWISKYNN